MDKESKLIAYLESLEPRYYYNADECPCKNGNFTIHTLEWDIYDSCGNCRDPPPIDKLDRSTTSKTYKRINYLIEYLNQVQGKEKTAIPKDIISELKKQQVTIPSIKKCLKDTNQKQYLDHAHLIYHLVTGNELMSIPYKTQKKIQQHFTRAEIAYQRINKTRNNFLGNNFVINRILTRTKRYKSKKECVLLFGVWSSWIIKD